jgi:Glycosyltransferase 61
VTAADWSGWPAAQGLPEPRLLRDILILPPREMYHDMLLPDGGPVWPDDDPALRFCRGNLPKDRAPAPSDQPSESWDAPSLWGGATNLAFGHMVAETMTRVAWSARQRPDDRMLFVVDPGRTARNLPNHFWDLLDWWGVPRDRAHIVDRPLRVAELRVMPQAEQLSGIAPSPAFLDLLDDNQRRAGLAPVPSGVLYVTRAGMIDRRMGAHLGESCLVDSLRAAGIAVLDPFLAPLRDQLAAYAGARSIVFAEGSALHGRQLLGRSDQRIVVLTRRTGSRIGRSALTPRCAELTYVDAVARNIGAYRQDGAWFDQRQVALADWPVVLDAFESLGVDLRPGWNRETIAQAERDDLRLWLAGMQTLAHRMDLARTRDRMTQDLAAVGHADLLASPDTVWLNPA